MWNEVEQALNQSISRMITGVANLLPGLVALIVALLVSSVIAWVLSAILRRSLKGAHFDEHLASWGMYGVAEWSPERSPTLLVSRVVAWGVMLVGFLIGVAAFDAALTEQLVMRLFSYLPNVMAALILLVFGNLIARFLARGVLIGAVNMNLYYARLLSMGVKWLVLVLAATMALNHLGIGGRILDLAFGILFGGIVLALALAVGMGSKELVSRSLERQATKTAEELENPFHHL
jgi:Conserved TM helix